MKGGGQLPVNAADEGPIDEEAERLAFQQAVEEWRRADGLAAQQGKKMEIVREYQGGKKSSAPKEDFGVMASEGDDGMWKNPWGAPPSEEKKKVIYSSIHLFLLVIITNYDWYSRQWCQMRLYLKDNWMKSANARSVIINSMVYE